MKKWWLSAIAVFCMCTQLATAEDLFPDKALEAAVRKQVFEKRDNDQPLTADDVKRISVVKGKSMGIKNLQGLEHCVALEELDLEDNKIYDISAIAELKLLLSVTLTDNNITDIKPLANLTRMQYLQLDDNQVIDISPLENISNMRSLYLGGNRIQDVSVLPKLTKLWSLNLAGNPVKDFSPLSELKGLDTMNFNHCGISDLSFLKPLPSIMSIQLMDNKITDLSVLVEMARADEMRRFSPFWRIFLKGNPLDKEATPTQIEELAKMGARITIE
ncbi:MAG: leucine-rich repeat domain-containing protein [Planctomycetales bacterium]|nr:leucine-rich repeat domain-containing protein [Planctomycetales bacterium]MCA9184688.1 leucine-rich repeat domain-containing protein [Planctomycetales bacterium]